MEESKYFVSVPGYYDYSKGVVSFWREVTYEEFKKCEFNGELVKMEPSKKNSFLVFYF